MINIVQADGAAERAVLEAMRARAARAGAAVDKAAAEIMEAVRERGFEAVREYSLRFDGAEPRELDPAELEAARSRCPAALIAALEHAAARTASLRFSVGGVTMTISPTPATLAGTAFMRTLLG